MMLHLIPVLAVALACQPMASVEPKAKVDVEAASAEDAQGRRTIFYIGHSLISDIPDMTLALADAGGSPFTWREQFILGSPLRWQWDEATRPKKSDFEPQYQGNYMSGITSATTDLVVTDSVPRGGTELVKESIDYLGRFAKFTRERSPNVRIWYYETWHCINSGTPEGCAYDNASPTRNLKWRERITADRKMWEQIAAEAGTGIRMIPAGTALGALVDAAKKGEIPGIKSEKDLFDDDIHLNPYGKYFVALVHYASLFQQSPVGLPYEIKDRWGRSYWNTPNWQKKQWSPPNPQAVKRMQEIAWTIVQKDPLTRPR